MSTSSGRSAHHEEQARPDDARGPTVTVLHWSSPDIERDILAEAWRPEAGEPVSIHIRAAVHARMLAEAHLRKAAAIGSADAGRPARLPFVIDDEIPVAPGYEVHRVPRQGQRSQAA